jgi:hypothetical protein
MKPTRTASRRARAVLFVTVAAVATATSPPPSAAQDPTWTAPVPGAVVRGYREPLAQFAAGHRGVDYSAPVGTPVRAANDGRVTFAGDVSGAMHVVVEHPNGIRTSYSFLERIDVARGDTVRRGTVLGAAGGTGEGHAAGVFHFGARVGDRYFDPMQLFEPTDLTQLVRLVPADELEVDDAQLIHKMFDDDGCGGLLSVICDIGEAIGDAAGWTLDRVEDALDLGLAALRTVAEAAVDFVETVTAVVREVMQAIRDVVEGVEGAIERLAELAVEGAVAIFEAVVEAGLDLYEALTSCPQPPPKAHSEGSGNIAVAVGGLFSSRERQAPDAHGDWFDESFKFRRRVLGYTREEVVYHSYREGSETYGWEDTLGDLHEQARSLGRQIKAAGEANPGRAIDLVGHSQGGLVIALFLTEVYAGHEDEYPPIENALTFGSPHEGTPVADLAQTVTDHLIAGNLLKLLDPTEVVGAAAIQQMTSDSDTITGLGDRVVPPSVRFLSVMGSEDPIVPSNRGDIAGGTKVVVQAGESFWPDDHSAVLHDDDAISAAQAHLEGRSPADTCGLFTDVGGTLYSELVDKATERVSLTPGGTAWLEDQQRKVFKR